MAAIATESGMHAKIALSCIERGINVIIEKPVALSLEDADEIIRMSGRKGVKVSVCHQNRFNKAVQELQRKVKAQSFGKVSHGAVNIRWNRNRAYYEQALWRGKWLHDGGCLLNQCIHGIDLLVWSMGSDVDEVYGVTANRLHNYIEVEDLGVAVLKFKSGAIATIEGTTNIYKQNMEETLSIFGEKGSVKIGGKAVNEIALWEFEDEDYFASNVQKCEEISDVYGNGHVRLYEDMIDAVENNRLPYVDAHAGRYALEIILAIYKSRKEGRAVKLPLLNFSTSDMLNTMP